jgi:hypothetical protein
LRNFLSGVVSLARTLRIIAETSLVLDIDDSS